MHGSRPIEPGSSRSRRCHLYGHTSASTDSASLIQPLTFYLALYLDIFKKTKYFRYFIQSIGEEALNHYLHYILSTQGMQIIQQRQGCIDQRGWNTPMPPGKLQPV